MIPSVEYCLLGIAFILVIIIVLVGNLYHMIWEICNIKDIEFKPFGMLTRYNKHDL